MYYHALMCTLAKVIYALLITNMSSCKVNVEMREAPVPIARLLSRTRPNTRFQVSFVEDLQSLVFKCILRQVISYGYS